MQTNVEGYPIIAIDGKTVENSPDEKIQKLLERMEKGMTFSMSGSEFCRRHWEAPSKLSGREPYVDGQLFNRVDDTWNGSFGDFEVQVNMPEIRGSGENVVVATVIVPANEIRRRVENGWVDGNNRMVLSR